MTGETPEPHLPAKTSHPTIVPGPLGQSPPANVPVFNCVVYVSKVEEGVRARVANLAGLEAMAASERAALAILVPAFKQQVGEFVTSETPIPWIDPPTPRQPDEQPRLIPVHL